MPGSTNRMNLPYPLGNETADVAGDIQRLAEAIDGAAETPAGAQAKVDAHAGAASPHSNHVKGTIYVRNNNGILEFSDNGAIWLQASKSPLQSVISWMLS